MAEKRMVASRRVDASTDKQLVSLARIVKKHGSRCARKMVDGNTVKVGIVSDTDNAPALGSELGRKGWTIAYAPVGAHKPAHEPKPEPKPKAKEEPEPEKKGPRLPHPLISETREARLGCTWGSPEMKSIAKSMKLTESGLAQLADSPGKAFGFFRFDPWRLWCILSSEPPNPYRDPQPRSDRLLALFKKNYGEENEGYKFFRLQSVGFRPELLNVKRRARK